MTREFLADTGLDEAFVERVVYLVSHHHTLTGIEGMDQICVTSGCPPPPGMRSLSSVLK